MKRSALNMASKLKSRYVPSLKIICYFTTDAYGIHLGWYQDTKRRKDFIAILAGEAFTRLGDFKVVSEMLVLLVYFGVILSSVFSSIYLL